MPIDYYDKSDAIVWQVPAWCWFLRLWGCKSLVRVELVLNGFDLLKELKHLLLSHVHPVFRRLLPIGALQLELEVQVSSIIIVGQFFGQIESGFPHGFLMHYLHCTGRKDYWTGILIFTWVEVTKSPVPTNSLFAIYYNHWWKSTKNKLIWVRLWMIGHSLRVCGIGQEGQTCLTTGQEIGCPTRPSRTANWSSTSSRSYSSRVSATSSSHWNDINIIVSTLGTVIMT